MTTSQAIREAKNRWARRRRRLIGYGQWQPFTDAAPVREHVLAITASGMGINRIAERTGVRRGTLDHLLYGTGDFPPAVRIRTESAETLLAYWPSLDDYDDHTVIDGTGTRRRMQALAAAGWTAHAVQRCIGIAHPQTFERLCHRDKVTARMARAVRDFYTEFSSKRPEENGVEPWIAERARTHAARKGWVGAGAWDDDTIDDPQFGPSGAVRDLNRDELAALRRADIEHLASFGCTPQQIHARLGDDDLALSTVRQIVQEWRTGVKRVRKQVAG